MSNDPDNVNALGARNYPPVGASTNINIGGLTQATSQINAFNTAMNAMSSTLSKFQSSAAGITRAFNQVSAAAAGTTGQATSTSSGGGFVSTMGNLASAAFGSVNQRGWMQDFMMFPARFMQQNIDQNRQLALQASAALGPQAFATGATTQSMMAKLAGQFGNVLGGNPSDLLNLMNIGSRVGAGINWNAQGPQAPGQWQLGGGPRLAGYMRSVMEAQRINPGADVGQLAGSIGGYAGNVGAQQQSAFLTGGAFSMIKSGNQQKSISEWAEGIMKWLQNLRPGPDRGKPFTYPELMTQNFPGSNIDAWLTANGVTDDMKQYFWSYAMARANNQGSTADDLFTKSSAVNQSVAFNRLKAGAAQTRTGFQLAGTLSGAYANKEQANQWFAQLTGHMLNQVLPTAMSSGPLSYMQYLPDTVQDMIMQLAERTGLGSLGAGVLGWGSMFPGLMGAGDVGDVGDFGPNGATSAVGMHPDARRRVEAMMAANPNIRVTSGFRDRATQQRLKRKGVGRVSGKPSDHTRGMAADLGPPSQYGWIARNARKFGLNSGANVGEPWHVGMGDIGDPISDALAKVQSAQSGWNMSVKDTISSMFNSLFGFIGSATGSTPEAQIAGVGGGISGLLKMLMGIFGQGTLDSSRLQYRDVYSQLVDATNKAPGLPPDLFGASTGGWAQKLKDIVAGKTTVGGTTPTLPGQLPVDTGGGGTTYDQFFRQVLSQGGFPVTQNNLDKLAAIVQIEGAGHGGNFNPFNSINEAPGSTRHNPVGGGHYVQNYADWQQGVTMTVHVLNQKNAKGWHDSIASDGPYSDWIAASQAFYGPWGNFPNVSESNAAKNLPKTMTGAGDLNYGSDGGNSFYHATNNHFHNSFTIQGGGAGGVDVRRTVTLIADQLEQEMQRRSARSN